MLDGNARLDSFEAEVRTWQAGDHARPLHDVLGLSADELLQVAQTPDALRYLVHARRFEIAAPTDVTSQRRVRDHAIRLAAEHVDPFEIAAVDAWLATLDDRPTPPTSAFAGEASRA